MPEKDIRASQESPRTERDLLNALFPSIQPAMDEYDIIDAEVRDSTDRFTTRMMEIMQTQSISYLRKTAPKIQELNRQSKQISDLHDSLERTAADTFESGTLTPQSAVSTLLYYGNRIYKRHSLPNKERELVKEVGAADEWEESFRAEVPRSSGLLLRTPGGLNLIDYVARVDTSPLTTAERMRDFSYITLPMTPEYVRRIAQEGLPEMYAKFPNQTVVQTMLARHVYATLLSADVPTFKATTADTTRDALLIRHHKQITRIRKMLLPFLETLEMDRTKMHQAVLDPSTHPEEFEVAQEMVLNQMPEGDSRLVLLHLLGNSSTKRIRETYRAAIKYSMHDGPYVPFYTKLRDYIKQVVDNQSDGALLSKDTINTIFNEEIGAEGDSIDDWSDIALSHGLEPRSYKLDLGSIDPKRFGFQVPETGFIIVEKGQPLKLLVRWTNKDTGETTVFFFDKSTDGSGTVDWSLLEDPHSDSVTVFRNACENLLATAVQSIIDGKNKPASQVLQGQETTIFKVGKRGKYRPDQELIDAKKELEQLRRAQQESEAGFLASDLSDPTAKIEHGQDDREVSLIKLDDIDSKFPHGFSTTERTQVVTYVNRYNENGAGRFRRNRWPGKDGIHRWVLTANTIKGPASVAVIKGDDGKWIVEKVYYARDTFGR